MVRREDIDRLYGLLEELEQTVGGKQKLKDCTGYMNWPDRGVDIFFAPDEYRESGDQLQVTRIGTRAVSEGTTRRSGTDLGCTGEQCAGPTKEVVTIEDQYSGNSLAAR